MKSNSWPPRRFHLDSGVHSLVVKLTGIPRRLGSTGCLNGKDSGSWFQTILKIGINSFINSSLVNTRRKKK